MTREVLVKICGVRAASNAAMVARAGADFVGLNFWPRSKRYLAPEGAGPVAEAVRAAGARVVGLFVDATLDEIREVHRRIGLEVVQLHGDEPADQVAAVAALGVAVWKALPVGDAASLAALSGFPAAAAILIDAPSPGRGGSGHALAAELVARARRAAGDRPLVLAGGLHPGNVAAAIAVARPWAVDVASGVESAPGEKDPALVEAFVAAVRAPRGANAT